MNNQRRRFITHFSGTVAGRCLLGPVAGSLAAGKAWAETEANPKFVSFITPLGHHQDWLPDGIGKFGDFTTETKPLEKHADDITIIKNANSVLQHFNGSGAHAAGYPAATTGNTNHTVGSTPSPALGVSLDQFLLRSWEGAQSLQLGVLPSGSNNSIISWTGPNKPLAPEKNARRIYDTIFQSLSGTDEEQEAIRFREQSVLDHWVKELNQLQSDLGSVHRQVLDQHLTNIEEVERRLNENFEDNARSCGTLDITNGDNFYDQNDNFPVIGQQMMDVIALALSCSQYRTASLAWSKAGSFVVPRWVLGNNARAHHTITHAADTDQAWKEISQIDTWYAEQFAYLINKLAETQDLQGGRLLDSTICYWVSEATHARSHSGAGLEVVLAGNYNNKLRNGIIADHKNRPLNDVLSTISNTLDVPIGKFGNADFATGNQFTDILN